jgi:tripartite-type tricarboxylate transporter receptor subunit TctC
LRGDNIVKNSLISNVMLGVALTVSAPLTWAASAWPNHQIQLVVPFAAGGGVDSVARAISAQLTQSLNQTVLVENRVGAGGLIGAQYVANAAPDGYTLLMGTQTTLAVAPQLNKTSSFDPRKAFAGVGMAASSPMLLVVNPSFSARSVGDLLALAKAHPGKLDYGSGGVGTTPHMAGALLSLMGGIQMTHVAYKGEQPALTDVMGNQIPLMFSNLLAALPLVKSGRLRALAISSAARSAAAPEIPTVAESGVPGFDAATWFGIVAPQGTPKDVIDKLNAEISRALDESQLRRILEVQGLTVQKSTPAKFDEYIASEYEKWGRVIKDAYIPVQ